MKELQNFFNCGAPHAQNSLFSASMRYANRMTSLRLSFGFFCALRCEKSGAWRWDHANFFIIFPEDPAKEYIASRTSENFFRLALCKIRKLSTGFFVRQDVRRTASKSCKFCPKIPRKKSLRLSRNAPLSMSRMTWCIFTQAKAPTWRPLVHSRAFSKGRAFPLGNLK